MRLAFICLFFAAAAFGQTNLDATIQITNTGVAVSYDAADTMTPYKIEVYISSPSALVYDVDPAMFDNAEYDLDRPDTIVDGTHRTVQIGHAGNFFQAKDGSWRDRVLQANTTYHWRVNGVSGTDFTTANIPAGQIVYSNSLPVRSPFVAARPSLNPAYQAEFRDIFTGALVKTFPDDSYAWGPYTGAGGVALSIAEGSGWTATGSTLVSDLANDDNYYAQTGTQNAKLFIGLGDVDNNKLLTSSSFATAISFINAWVRTDCNGSGCGSGIDVNICLTYDATTCASATKTFTATTTESNLRICHPENSASLCPAANDPGDVWAIDGLFATHYKLGQGKVWNGATGGCSGSTTLCFTSADDCQAMRSNTRTSWWYGAAANAQVVSTSCGSTPPQVTLNGAWPADGNGATGYPFYYLDGMTNNPLFGFLIWKKDNVANATLRLDSFKWEAASKVNTGGIDYGAGGFPPRCQLSSLKTPSGYTFCASFQGFWLIREEMDGTLGRKFMGMSYFFLGGVGANNSLWTPETFTWSNTEVGVLYITSTGASGTSPATGGVKNYLIRVEFNNKEKGCGETGTTCVIPSYTTSDEVARIVAPDVTVTNLTPCLNTCGVASDDYTLGGQMMRLYPSYNYARFGNAGIKAVQGNFVILAAKEGASQDSFDEYFIFDIGNGGIPGSTYTGSEGNTQQVYRHLASYAATGFRWAGDHTHSPVLGTDAFTVIEAGDKSSYGIKVDTALSACTLESACGLCPSITVDGYDFTGHRRCDTVTVSSPSAWNMAWEAQPVDFEDGDPLNDGGCSDCNLSWHWIQKLAVGDRLTIGTFGVDYETVKLLQRVDNKTWVIERGCGSDQSFANPKNHSAGVVWRTKGATTEPVCANDGLAHYTLGIAWDWINQQTHWTPFVNHAVNTSTTRFDAGYQTQIGDFTSWSNISQTSPVSTYSGFGTFEGTLIGPTGPNAVEHHPGYQNFQATDTTRRATFFDAEPYLSMDDMLTVSHVSGSLYRVTGLGRFGQHAKLTPYGAFIGLFAFKQSYSIDDTATHWGEICYGPVANDCFAGSIADSLYINGPIDIGQLGETIEFWSGQTDLNVGANHVLPASAAAEIKLPPNTSTSLSANHFRRLLTDVIYRSSATANDKPFVEGKFIFIRDIYGAGVPTYVVAPPFPSDDGKDRTHFLAKTITVDPANVPMGTSKARLKNGYNQNYICNTNANQACYSVASSIGATPFKWANELTGSDGVACASGCMLALPLIEGQPARFQVEFVDGSGNPTGSLAPCMDLSGTTCGGLVSGGGGGGGTPTSTPIQFNGSVSPRGNISLHN